MRASQLVAFAVSVTTVSTFGIRGAAERATLFAMYLSEEIFDDSAKDLRGIATGCVGTRTGIRGQAKRCNIMEFCQYLWTETEATMSKPDPNDPTGKKRINFKAVDEMPEVPKSFTAKRLDPASNDLKQFTDTIGSVKQKVKNPTDPKPPKTFTGNLKVANVVDGVSSYYDVMKAAAKRAAVAVEAFENASGLDNNAKKALAKWNKQTAKGLEFVYALRVKEDAVFKLNPPQIPDENGNKPKSLATLFGAPIETRAHEYPDILRNGAGLEWNLTPFTEPDMDATINKCAASKGGVDNARADWRQAVDDFYDQHQTGPSHRQALNSAADAKGSLLGCA